MLVRATFAVLMFSLLAIAEEPKKPMPKFKQDKAITHVLGPLDSEGYIDYETALNERLKGKIKPDQNAIVVLLKCFGPKPEGIELHADFYKWLDTKAPPVEGDYLVGSFKYFQQEYQGEKANEFNDFETRLRQKPWKPADSPKHTEWLKANEKPLAVAIEASRCTDYFHPMISRTKDGSRGQLLGALLPMVQKQREIASQLSFRVTRHLGAGKVDEAFADALTIHRLARLAGRGATLIELLVGIALDAIAHSSELAIFEHGKPTAKQCLAYQAELMKLPPMPSVLEKINLGERFWSLDAVQSMASKRFNAGDDFLDFPKELVAESLDFELMLRRMNGWYDKIEKIMTMPSGPERTAATAAFENELREVSRNSRAMNSPLKKFFLMAEEPEKRRAKVSENIANILVGLLMPAFQKVKEASTRCDQTQSNGIIAAVLAAHFADTGKYPEKLADLVPKYLAKVPQDAFNDKDLTYKKVDNGYLFYSVGLNRKDDGGKLLLDPDEPRGDDVGVRMPRK